MCRPSLAPLAALGLAAILAACGGPTQPTDQGFREVRAEMGASEAPVLGASLVFLDGAVLNAASFAEAFEGVWLAGFAAVADDGTVTIDLPDGADVPPSLLAPAADLLDPNWFSFTCVLDVSNADANVTPVVILEYLSFPGISALTASGAAFTTTTAQPFDPDEDDFEAAAFLTFVYADASTTIATPSGGCTEGSTGVFVDVELSAGWNQLAWRFVLERDPVTDEVTGTEAVHLGNDDSSPVHLGPETYYLGDEFASGSALGLGDRPVR